MCRILTESCVVKIHRPEFGIVLNREMLLGKLIKRIFCAKEKKKKSTHKLLRKFYYKPGLIHSTMG